MTSHKAGIARADADYRRIGLSPDTVELWEDGARTDGRSGTYEWWYFDSHLDNGATLVVIFMTKDLAAPGKPLSPMIRLNLDLPDGRKYQVIKDFPAESYTASCERPDVRISDNIFRGDLSHYEIRVEVDGIKVDVTLDSDIRPWRPHTGYVVFGTERDREFSWLPSVPQGTVRGTVEVDEVRSDVTGIGYHDHNWGNVGMMSIINDWYWARGQAGPYSVISSYITAHEKYDFEPIPIFMLARDGEIVADDASKVTFEATGIYTDEATGKPVGNVTRYTYRDGDDEYIVTFTRKRDLVANKFVDQMKGWRKAAAKLVRVDGAYLRFTGELTVSYRKGSQELEAFTEQAIWELMYFGHAR
ncbi:MAG: hydroxyneurosporene dehydrogenase [Pseudonocardia sp. SCN 72-86]|nr:MAG: hydroxyneurosporene dehydrogenase [Pseudonocardia sp. SCN 72-86]